MNWKIHSKEKVENVIIVGCGRLGATLADDLSNQGADVTVIDKSKEAFQKLPPSFGGITLAGDATDLDTLLDAQILEATAFIAVTNNDNTNIMTAQIAKKLFRVDKIICRLYDPERETAYSDMDIQTICPAILSANAINKLMKKSKEMVS